MGSKLFVGNLSFQVSDFELEDLFKEHGEVTSAKVIVDRRTGRSKGYGFVEMVEEDQARNAIEALNGLEIKGRPINVSLAKSQDSRESQRGTSSGNLNSGWGYSEF